MSGKFALIIGNTEYTDPGLAQLTAPGKDAEDFARVLKEQGICAFDEVDILLNQPEPIVRGAIDEFFDLKKPDDLLVLYFSGHGVRDELGALYLAVKNTIRSRLRSTAVKSDYIREAMDQSRSRRQVLVLDCCNSGAFPHGTKAATGVSIGTATAFESGYGRIILTASDATQFAWEGDKIIGETDNSLFTHYLVEGLEGEADLDGDGRITVDELYDYAYEKVRLATPKQTPSKFSSKEQGEIILRQSTRIENIKPLPLSAELTDEIEDTRPYVREAAVQKLEKILRGRNIGLARSAKEVLVRIAAEDDSRHVSQTATQVLESIRQVEQKAEEERKAREEAERLAMLKAEEERLAREKAEAERKAKEEIEKLARAQAEHKAAEAEAARLKAERQAAELAAHEATEKVTREKAEKEASEREAARLEAEREVAREKADRDAALKAEREAMKVASRKKTEREAAEKAEREAMELAARRKTEREATEKAAGAFGKTASPQSALQRQPILKWTIIGVIGLCTIATGAWGISYLASLGTPSPTEGSKTKAPATDVPTTKQIATERTNTRTPIPTNTPYTLPIELIISFEKNGIKKGLSLDTGGDVDTQIVTASGSQARLTGTGKILSSLDGNTTGDSFMQFFVDDKIMYAGQPTTFVLIQIEYFDQGKDDFNVNYDAMGNAGPYKNGKFTQTCKITKGNTLVFKKATFAIKDARFADQDNGADFRISDYGDGAEIIRLVRVLLLSSLDVITSDSCGIVK